MSRSGTKSFTSLWCSFGGWIIVHTLSCMSHVSFVDSFKRPYVYTYERPFQMDGPFVSFYRCFVFTPLTIRCHLAKFFFSLPIFLFTRINCKTFQFFFLHVRTLELKLELDFMFLVVLCVYVFLNAILFQSKMLGSISSRFFNLAAGVHRNGMHSFSIDTTQTFTIRTCWMHCSSGMRWSSFGGMWSRMTQRNKPFQFIRWINIAPATTLCCYPARIRKVYLHSHQFLFGTFLSLSSSVLIALVKMRAENVV